MRDEDKNVEVIYDDIKRLVEESRKRVYSLVNTELLNLYWNIGKIINEMQGCEKRAKYGEGLLQELSNRLTEEFGKGFSVRNLRQMKLFYSCYSIWQTLSAELGWSHYIELIKIKDKRERDFYMVECVKAGWDVRTLKRQKKSLLYERIMLNSSEERKELLPVKGNIITSGKDLVKNPYILEFLDLKDNMKFSESELEKNILNHLKEFMLELGKGFMFVGSQVRINNYGENFFPDLVFYNRILKCFVIIDLKIGRILHKDIGQMAMYVSYYDKNIKKEDEGGTIRILLGTTKNKTAIKYMMREEDKNVFASIYKLHFPSEEELINIILEEKRIYEKEEKGFPSK